jgi:hypothetical protein
MNCLKCIGLDEEIQVFRHKFATTGSRLQLHRLAVIGNHDIVESTLQQC